MEPTDDDLGEVIDPADLPEWEERRGGYTPVGSKRLPAFLQFALGDPKLSAWEERFILDIGKQDQGYPISRKQWATIGRIAHKIGFDPES